MVSFAHTSLGTPSTPSGNGTSVTLTTNQTVAAGDVIVLFIYAWMGVTNITGVSGGSLSYVEAVQGRDQSAQPHPGIYYAVVPSGLASGASITASYGASVDARVIAGCVLTGVDTADPLGNVGASLWQNNSPVSTWASRSVTIAADSLLIGFIGEETAVSSSATAASGSTELMDFPDAYGNRYHVTYRIEASGGSYTVGGTWSSTGKGTACAAEFLASSGGGAPASVVRPRTLGQAAQRAATWCKRTPRGILVPDLWRPVGA